MKATANDVLLIIGIDTGIFLILILGFALYRKLRSPKIGSDINITVLHPYLEEADHSILSISRRVRKMSLKEINEQLGEWAFMYLILHQFILYCLIALIIPGTAGLMLIYYMNSSDQTNKNLPERVNQPLHVVSITAILNDPNLLIYPLIFLCYSSFLIYGLGFKFMNDVLWYRETNPLLKTQNTTIMIKKISRNFNSIYISDILKKSLELKHRSAIRVIYTVPYYIESFKLYKKIKKIDKKCRLLELDYEKKGEKTTIRKCCKKTDGLHYYEKIKHLSKMKFIESFNKDTEKNSGIAFVLLNDISSAKQLLITGLEPIPDLEITNWECVIAPAYHDIIWENVGLDYNYSIFLKFFLNLIYILIFMIFITPTILAEELKYGLDYMDLTYFIVGTLSISLPGLVIMIYQLIILPPVVTFLVNSEKHTQKHLRVSSSIKKYFFFFYTYSFIFPIFQIQLTRVLELFIQTNWQVQVAVKANYTGEVFLIFIVHQALIKNGLDLLAASKYIISATKAYFTADAYEEKKLCYEAQPFEFDFELAVSLSVFLIICAFSVVFPVILIPGLLFFAIRYFVHKHNILAVYYVEKEATAFPSLLIILFAIFFSAFNMQVITAATLVLSNNSYLKYIGEVIAGASVVLFIMCFIIARYHVRKGRIAAIKGQVIAYDIHQDEYFYKHPMDR